MFDEKFQRVESLQSPIAVMKEATELLLEHQQIGYELARLRKQAIDEASEKLDMSYADIAKVLGVTRGRVGQLRQSGPPRERIFFGYGPVDVWVAGDLNDPGSTAFFIDSVRRSSKNNIFDRLFNKNLLHVNLGNLSEFIFNDCRPYLVIAKLDELEQYPNIKQQIIDLPEVSTESKFFIGREKHEYGDRILLSGKTEIGIRGGLAYLTNNLSKLYSEFCVDDFSTWIEISTREILEEMISDYTVKNIKLDFSDEGNPKLSEVVFGKQAHVDK